MSISLTQIGFLDHTPCRRIALALRQACDEVAGIAQGAQIAAIGQGGIVEGAVPAFVQASILDQLLDACLLMPQQRRRSRHPPIAAEGRQ
jgi:hypothetical protein